MGRSTSGVWASGVLVLLAATVAFSMSPVAPPPPAEQNLPATDINRERNNPAKEAIRARQAQEVDKAGQKAAEEQAALNAGPVADRAQLAQRVDDALRNDARTAKLGVAVRLEELDLIGLHGSVPSEELRAAVIEVATRVAGAPRLKSHLVVTARK